MTRLRSFILPTPACVSPRRAWVPLRQPRRKHVPEPRYSVQRPGKQLRHVLLRHQRPDAFLPCSRCLYVVRFLARYDSPFHYFDFGISRLPRTSTIVERRKPGASVGLAVR
jgi:hypothetical protein